MAGKAIVPIVLEPNLPVPGFISNVKHLRAYENWDGAFITLQNFVDAQAMQAAQRQQARHRTRVDSRRHRSLFLG